MSTNTTARAAFSLCLLLACEALTAAAAADRSAGRQPPREPAERSPDLQLEWADGDNDGEPLPPLRGVPGERLSVGLRTRNLGSLAAFALILESHTAIGRHGRPRRIQPGPEAGAALAHQLELTLAGGMRELCVTARLQLVEAGDPPDQNPDNDRICRAIELVEPAPADARSGRESS